MKIEKDSIDKFFNYGLHIESRTIYLSGVKEDEVDYSMADHAVKGLHILDCASDDAITVILNTPGGDWYNGMAIYDAISRCKSHVTIRVMGYAMSMGAVILQAGDKRVMTPNSSLMIHYGTDVFDGHFLDMERVAKESQRFRKIMEQIFIKKMSDKNPGTKISKLRELLKFDTYLSPEKAVELGLADEVES